MEHVIALCILMGSLLTCGSCTECWHCENAASATECVSSGIATKCGDTEVCSTEVRRVYDDILIWKGCRQRVECEKQRLKNWERTPHTCNNDQNISHCWCCCDDDSCNKNETCKVISERCPTTPLHIEHGQVTCSKANHLGSLCSYRCNEAGYHGLPLNKQDRLCLGNGKWSEKKPCCVKACPPFVPLDLIVVSYSNNQENFLRKAFGFGAISRTLTHSEKYFQEFIVYYNEDIYQVISPPVSARTGFFKPSVNGSANLGAALRYVRDNLLGNFDRNVVHSDVILVGAEKQSDDDVTKVAAELKKDGAIIYYTFFENDEHEFNMEEARNISSSEDHIFVVRELKEETFRNLFDKVVSAACNYRCPEDEDF